MALDKNVLREVRNLYRKLEGEGRLIPEGKLSSYYDRFRERFAPDKLASLGGEDLVDTMHSHANKESLVYWLEFKSDVDFDTNKLGNIRGGNALKFGIYRNAKTKAWMGKGPKGLPVEIPLEQAVNVAEEHRRQLERGCELLEALTEGGEDGDYKGLQEKMDAEAPDVSNLVWGHKYFSLLYPGKLDDYHNPRYQRHHLVKLLQVPPGGDGRYIAAGRYVRIANELDVPLANLTQMLNHRDGDPHRYWRILVNYPNLGQDWMNWPAMRDGGFVAIGWEDLGDLSAITHNQAGKEELRSLMESRYNASSWTNQVYDFVADLQPNDVVLAFQSSTVLGIGKVTGPYHYDPSSNAPHSHPVEWLSSTEWELPEQEAQGSTVRELKNYENLVAAESILLDARTNKNGGGHRMPENAALNTILYGPPGTGKTYSVQRRALDILEPGLRDEDVPSAKVSERFREYVDKGRIEFVTFHPSYSYEEFVEGFRYDPEQGVPTLHKGSFQAFADNAANPHQNLAPAEGARIWKVSLGGGTEPHIFKRCMENDEIAVGWLQDVDLTDSDDEAIASLFGVHHPGKSTKSVDYLVNGMRVGDYVAVFGSVKTIRAIGVITGEYEYKGDVYDHYQHVRPVAWLDTREHDIVEMNGNKKLTLQTIYELQSIPLQRFVRLLPQSAGSEVPYVLIIDEINRGNISRIFGELITLLEPDKRRGAPNELSLRLPYSGRAFTVPANLHVIGTMNTADRSIALLDVALRRRFEFEEMMPDVGIVRKVLGEKAKRDAAGLTGEQLQLVCEVFERLNARLRALLDRDHQLGHGYFLDATSMARLHEVFYRRILPLLQEYFYNDRERLERMLGAYNQAEGRGFVERSKEEYGFGFSLDEGDEVPWEYHVYGVEELEQALQKTFVGT